MKYSKLNMIAGFSRILLAGFGGMALGKTFDQFALQDGHHVLSTIRFYFARRSFTWNDDCVL